ncbi:MAG TPA: alpha/beta hydrolase [Mycobacteriales bacterium]|nr:alpha/beta hydrolase [Mycobacteriales bacterium]
MASRALPYDVIGTGPRRVLVLHGWLGDRSSFDAIRPHLGAEFSYCFVDYRGYGDARGVSGDYTVEEIAGDALATADALGWTDFAVLGHSMGGKAAQSLLLAAPERVRALVGISPVPASGVPLDDDGWALFSGAIEEPANRRVIIDLTTGNRLPAAWLDAMVDRSVDRSDPRAFRGYLDSWATGDFHQRIDGNTVPVLVLTGAHDPALSAELMRSTWLRWYPNSELVEFADAGHYAPDELPLALVSTVERFLTGG